MSGAYSNMKVVFPAPPPTTNDLTAPQRAQLLRKTKKIEQLLGATPHLLDITGGASGGPIQITFSAGQDSPSKRRFESVRRRTSIDSEASSSSSAAGSALRRTASVVSSRSSSILPISASVSRPGSSMSMSSRCSSPAALPITAIADSLVVEDAELSFVIPTANSVRKQKMDRLRKKLGSGVPLELVFPGEKEEVTPQPVFIESLPPAVPKASKKTSKRIARARDSIADASSIHRAAKKDKVQGTIVPALKKKKSRASLIIGSPIPTSSSSTITTISLAEARRRQRLSRIVESPEEEFSLNVLRLSRRDLSALAAVASHGDLMDKRTAEWVSQANDMAILPKRPSGGERRKRPTSYRKPVPTFLVDSDNSSASELEVFM